MKTLLLFLLLLTTFFCKAQNEISISKLQKFLSAKVIDDVENDLKSLNYSFREAETISDGTSKLLYERINSKTYALDFIAFFKNKSNVGFSGISFNTYEEQQFHNLKTEFTAISKIQGSAEEVSDGCLERTYNTKQYQFHFNICTEKSNERTLYRIEILNL